MRARSLHKSWLLACCFMLAASGRALPEHICRPALAVKDARYSAMHLPRLERTWTAELWVDASPCLSSSGAFEIVFSIEKENAMDYEVRAQFIWRPGKISISKEFWVDEAVAHYRIDGIAPCSCRS
jgi:hypothetical protein